MQFCVLHSIVSTQINEIGHVLSLKFAARVHERNTCLFTDLGKFSGPRLESSWGETSEMSDHRASVNGCDCFGMSLGKRRRLLRAGLAQLNGEVFLIRNRVGR